MKTVVVMSPFRGDTPAPPYGGRFLITAMDLPVDPSTLTYAHAFLSARPLMSGIKVGFVVAFSREPRGVHEHLDLIRRVEGSSLRHLHPMGPLVPRLCRAKAKGRPPTESVVLPFDTPLIDPLFSDFFGPRDSAGAWLASLLRPTVQLEAYFQGHQRNTALLGIPTLNPI